MKLNNIGIIAIVVNCLSNVIFMKSRIRFLKVLIWLINCIITFAISLLLKQYSVNNK